MLILLDDDERGEEEDKDDDVGGGKEDGWRGPSDAAVADSESGDVTTTVWNGKGDGEGGSSLLQHFMIE